MLWQGEGSAFSDVSDEVCERLLVVVFRVAVSVLVFWLIVLSQVDSPSFFVLLLVLRVVSGLLLPLLLLCVSDLVFTRKCA